MKSPAGISTMPSGTDGGTVEVVAASVGDCTAVGAVVSVGAAMAVGTVAIEVVAVAFPGGLMSLGPTRIAPMTAAIRHTATPAIAAIVIRDHCGAGAAGGGAGGMATRGS